MEFSIDNGALLAKRAGEILRIEPWGKDALRVRSTMLGKFSDNVWALTENNEKGYSQIDIYDIDHWVGDGTIDKRTNASITNGRIRAEINFVGIISFYRNNELFRR